ncbi:uncharacterized protein [Typha latifolia]|uniref:uncharacterized protein n=1 Tax=Typha latifolia TaxID=4733 RepID=UPI003C2CAE96
MMTNCCHWNSGSKPHLFLQSKHHGFIPHTFPQSLQAIRTKKCFSGRSKRRSPTSSNFRALSGLLPVDPWSPTVDSQSIASQLFAVSLFPYLGFLYYITRSKTAPKLTLFGFYFLLAFVGATIPAGIYAKVHYGTSLSNVDWLHGGAEFLLTLTNLFIVLGLREALRKLKDPNNSSSEPVSEIKEKSSV